MGEGPGEIVDPALVGAIAAEIRQRLGRNTAGVVDVFLQAEPTVAGLRLAAESLRGRPRRLLSPATMNLIADRALAILERDDVQS